MEVTGILKVKSDTQVVSDRFKKRDFVLTLEVSTPYPQHVTFQLVQDKVSALDTYQVGEEIKVQFNLKGREWTSPQGEVKYFNTLDAWRIEKTGNVQQQNIPSAESQSTPVFTSNSKEDDLPF